MGKLILTHAKLGIKDDKEVYKTVDWQKEFSGKVVAFDTSLLVHQIIHNAAVAKAILLENYKPLNTELKWRISKLREHNITPKFVLDGLDQPGKAAEQAKRKAKQAEAADRLQVTGSKEKDVIAAATITEALQTNLLQLFIEVGVAYEVAPYQADPQCVQAQREGRADFLWSRDTDLLAHGAQNLIVEWSWSSSYAKLITAESLFSLYENSVQK